MTAELVDESPISPSEEWRHETLLRTLADHLAVLAISSSIAGHTALTLRFGTFERPVRRPPSLYVWVDLGDEEHTKRARLEVTVDVGHPSRFVWGEDDHRSHVVVRPERAAWAIAADLGAVPHPRE